ncbi:MAG: flagellar type III secretion system pore protein FliP [Actinomycetota bacterium]|nr:flagellar type III secretion system pore protein FliP [Actinomycetota bacterium]
MPPRSHSFLFFPNMSTRAKVAWVAVGLLTLICWGWAAPASAQDGPVTPTPPTAPTTVDPSTPGDVAPSDPDAGSLVDGTPGPARDGADGEPSGAAESGGLNIDVDLGGDGATEEPSKAVTILLGLTVLAVAPSILLMMTSFTRIVVVLSLTRNALGVQAIPPNQVLVGLAMFLTFFVMAPVLTEVNDTALQPYLDGQVTQSEALKEAEGPFKEFMLANTRSSDLEMMIGMSGGERPESPKDTSMVALVPAFVLSELQSAFIIGIVIFVPFVVIDLVVAAVLMSLGMMMLPPVFVSLPLKLLVFVMVDGWALTAEALVANYRGGG